MTHDRRLAAIGVYVSTASLAVMVAVVGFFSPDALGGFSPFALLALVLSATTVFAGLYLTDFPFASVRADPREVLPYLASRLRFSLNRVEERPGELRIILDSWAVVRIRAVAEGVGTRIDFRADLTPGGLGVVLLLLLLTPIALLAMPILAYGFVRSRGCALRSVAPLLPVEGPLPVVPGRDEVGELLVNGLAEGHRMARDAYESERSSYWDSQAIVFLGALIVWAVVLLASLTYSSDPDFARRVGLALELAVAGGAAFWIAGGLLVRHRFRPHLRLYRERSEELRIAWAREVSRIPSEALGQSAFEVLAESSRHVPEWLEAVHREGFSRDPAAGLGLIAGVFWAIWAFPAAAIAAGSGNLVLAVGLALAGIGLTAGLVIWYRRWETAGRARLAAETDQWNRRFENLRTRMEKFLEGL